MEPGIFPKQFSFSDARPLLEFAERCQLLGQNFGELGEVVVDRCCDFRRRIHEALPEVSVVQDFHTCQGTDHADFASQFHSPPCAFCRFDKGDCVIVDELKKQPSPISTNRRTVDQDE